MAGHVHTPLTPPCEVRREITQLTSDAIVTAMAKQPGERFSTYGQFQMAMENARSQLLVEGLKHQQDEERKDQGRSWWRR